MHRQRGFTLIELLVVIGILSLLVVTFAPAITDVSASANQIADQRNQQALYANLQTYERKTGHLPFAGGHRFLLAPWVEGVIERSQSNLERYFNPNLTKTNAHFHSLRKLDPRSVWTDFASTSSIDTDYAGRAEQFVKPDMYSGNEAWIADDNEDGWAFRDGTINVLYGDGVPRQLIAMQLREQFGWEVRPDHVFKSCGPDSPHQDLRKLAQ